jgi:hypothetical protein
MPMTPSQLDNDCVFFQKPEEAPAAAVCGVVSDRDEVSGGVFWLLCWVLLSSSSSLSRSVEQLSNVAEALRC